MLPFPANKIYERMAALVLLTGCTQSIGSTVTIKNVKRVLMHEPSRYTFLYQQGNSKELLETTLMTGKARKFADVPAGADDWIEYNPIMDHGMDLPSNWNCLNLEIHLHSASDINGAGWDHGKFGRGETTVVE